MRATKSNASIGGLVSSFIDGGNLAPDDLVMQIILERLARPDCQSGYLFDGFPRTVVQAELFDAHLKHCGQSLDAVIHLVADEQALVGRLLARGKVEHRADDTPETISARLVVFHQRTAPVLEHYEKQGLVCSIDAMASPDQVFQAIVAVLEKRA